MAGIIRMLKFKKFLHFHYICFLQQQFPTFLAPGTGFMGDNFSKDGGGGDGFKMFQAHYIDCAFCFYYYYISSALDHQALDPGGWGLLCYSLGWNHVSVIPFAWTCSSHRSSELWESMERGFTITLWRKWTLRLRTQSRYFSCLEELSLLLRRSWTLWYFLFNCSFLWSWHSSRLTQLPWSFSSNHLKLWLILNTLFSALSRNQVIPGVGNHQKVSVSHCELSMRLFKTSFWPLCTPDLLIWADHSRSA